MYSTVDVLDSIHPGAKATLLARLLKEKVPVESGFIVASHAFEAFIGHNSIHELLDELLLSADPSSMKDVQAIARQIKRKILHGEFPDEIATQVSKMYVSFGQPRVMLSPSFLVSEHESPLFTEIESYFFGYEGDANLFEGIKELWSHFFDSKPLFYRLKHNKNHFTLPFSVCVQRQPVYKTTAVVYTDDPTSHTKQTTLVKAVAGEGALVHDIEGADYYWIKRGTGEVYNTLFDTQYEKVTFANGREQTVKLSASAQGKRKLTAHQLTQVAKLAKDLQQLFFFPQECVVGFDGERCVLVETKSLTAQTQVSHAKPSISQPITAGAKTVAPLATSVTFGLIHEFTSALHTPIASRIEGHLSLQPQLFLQPYSKDTGRARKELKHTLTHALEFILTHTRTHRGLLYHFSDMFENPDLTQVQLAVLSSIHKTQPALPIVLSAQALTFEEYQKNISLWIHHGLARSSHIHHANIISTPAQLYRMSQYAQVGMDMVIIDLDSLNRHIHGQEDAASRPDESEAVLDMVKKAVDETTTLGISICIQSTRAPTHAMLEIIQSSVSPEWLTVAQTYTRVANV